MTTALDIEASGQVVRVTMRAKSTRNGLDSAMVTAISDALSQAEHRQGTLIFVLAADGPDFCAGMRMPGEPSVDVAGGAAQIPSQDPGIEQTKSLLTRLSSSPLITVALVEGAAIGGGVGLAAACDHVIAGPTASFRLTETLWGLVPALIFPLIARRVSPHQAFTLALTNRMVDAEQAEKIGLADQWSADAAAALRQFVVGLRRADAEALRALKRHYRELFPLEIDPQGSSSRLLRERMADPFFLERSRRLEKLGVAA